jgi:hypothetical protein
VTVNGMTESLSVLADEVKRVVKVHKGGWESTRG